MKRFETFNIKEIYEQMVKYKFTWFKRKFNPLYKLSIHL